MTITVTANSNSAISAVEAVQMHIYDKKRVRTRSITNAQKKSPGNDNTPGLIIPKLELLILALACSFRLLLTLYAWLLIMLSLTDFLLDTRLSTTTLKSAQCTVQRLVFLNDYGRHA